MKYILYFLGGFSMIFTLLFLFCALKISSISDNK